MAAGNQPLTSPPLTLPRDISRPAGRPCTVCNHPERDKVDAALTDKTITIADIAVQFGLANSSVDRHLANHLPARLVKVAEELAVERESQFAKLAVTQSLSRLTRIQTRTEMLEQIRAARAAAADPQVPGDATGLLIKRKRSIKTSKDDYEVLTEAEIDTALLAEERALERAAAIETGEYLAQMGRGQFGQGEGGKGPLVVFVTGGLHPVPQDAPSEARHRIQDPRRQKAVTAQQPESVPLSMVDIEQEAEYLPDTREQSLSGVDLELEDGGPEVVAGGDEDAGE